MTESLDIRSAPGADELTTLHDEIRRYLDAVDAFRREGREPSWRRELAEEEALR